MQELPIIEVMIAILLLQLDVLQIRAILNNIALIFLYLFSDKIFCLERRKLMGNVTIKQLGSIPEVSGNDLFAIYDYSNETTNKIDFNSLKG